MHSDAAAQRRSGAGQQTDQAADQDARVDKACAAELPAEALYNLARELRDEGMPQQALYWMYEVHLARRTDDADEAAFDGLADAMDYICGWHAAGDTMGLFGHNSMPQTQARAREWAEAREQRETDDAAAASR
jgi:hypothetical protein